MPLTADKANVPPVACVTDVPTKRVGKAVVVILTGTVSVRAVTVNSYGGTMSSFIRGRPSTGNTSRAIVPRSELAFEKRVVATKSFSSLVMVSRTMQRAITSHGSGVAVPELA